MSRAGSGSIPFEFSEPGDGGNLVANVADPWHYVEVCVVNPAPGGPVDTRGSVLEQHGRPESVANSVIRHIQLLDEISPQVLAQFRRRNNVLARRNEDPTVNERTKRRKDHRVLRRPD
jgi:hypothetical protein